MRLPRYACPFAIGLLLLAACSGDPGSIGGETPPEDDATTGAMLSAPIPRGLVPLPGPAGASLVFVAAPPGTVPRGARALVRTSRGDSAVASMLDGGFDPVALAAAEGDAVEVRIVDSAGASTEAEFVATRRRPRVVRTSPQPRSTDVPLNVRVTVVFSTPMDSAAVVAGVRIVRGGVPVPGTLQPAPDGLSVAFEPVAALAAQADYEVTIAADVRDVLGTPLGEPVQVPFRTGTTTPVIDGMELYYYGRFEIFPGERVEIRAIAGSHATRDAWRGVPTQWSVSPDGALLLTELSPGVVRAEVGEVGGEVVLTATVAPGVSESVRLRTYRDLPSEVTSARVWYAPDDGNGTGSMGVWTERLDGTGREQLFALSELPVENTVQPLATYDCHEPHGFALSRMGRLAITVASASPSNHNGGTWIKDGPGGALRRVTPAGEPGSASFPAWSFDGARLAYWFDRPDQGMTELRVVEADGTGQRVLERVPFPDLYGTRVWTYREDGLGFNVFFCPDRQPHGGVPLVWHPDGQRVLKWRVEGPDLLVDGTDQVALDGSGSSLYMPGALAGPWLPDGERQFVYLASFGPWGTFGYLHAVNGFAVARRDGTMESWSPPPQTRAPLVISPDGRLEIVQGSSNRVAILTADRTAGRIMPRPVRGFLP